MIKKIWNKKLEYYPENLNNEINEIVYNVSVSHIRTKHDLKRCGCNKCLMALKILEE